MIVIITANKSGKGNGKRSVIDVRDNIDANLILTEVERFSELNKIRIELGYQWICSRCSRKNVTKLDYRTCGFCRLVSNHDTSGKLTDREIEALIRENMIEQGKCTKCGQLKINCQCGIE